MSKKYCNFKLEDMACQHCGSLLYHATVDEVVTSGFLFWKHTTITKRQVYREFTGCWHFSDTGELTPGTSIEELAEEYRVRNHVDC